MRSRLWQEVGATFHTKDTITGVMIVGVPMGAAIVAEHIGHIDPDAREGEREELFRQLVWSGRFPLIGPLINQEGWKGLLLSVGSTLAILRWFLKMDHDPRFDQEQITISILTGAAAWALSRGTTKALRWTANQL